MISYEIEDRDLALQGLFESTMWDNFYLVEAALTTDLHVSLDPTGEQKWGEVRELAGLVMRRDSEDRSFQITLRPNWDLSTNEIFAGVEKVFVHLRLQNQKLYVVTGVSYQTFVVGKSAEREWDRMTGVFLRKNHIAFET